MYYLSVLKRYERRFLSSKIENQNFYSILHSDLQELKFIAERIKKFCKIWLQKEIPLDDSSNNEDVFKYLLRSTLDVYSTIEYFKTLIEQRMLTSSNEVFYNRNRILKSRIEDNKESIEKLKSFGFEKMLDDENLESNIAYSSRTRDINFFYQEDNGLVLQKFEIFVKKRFYPASFSVFEQTIYLCIQSYDQYLKILRVDLNAKNHLDINKYLDVGEENNTQRLNFGYGSKYSIIRIGSEGKMFLLKSLTKKPREKIKDARDSFELLVLDKDLNKLACIKIEENRSSDNSVKPAILDLVILNDRVYTLDMKRRCIKIFNESLELLKMIPIPRSVMDQQTNHFAVSSKFILICSAKTIYCIKNEDQNTEFKKFELDDFILNIAFYDAEHILVRFINNFCSIKIGENLSDIKYFHFPLLERVKNYVFTNFMIKDNFLYFLCEEMYQVWRINFTLNNNGIAIQ